MSFRAEVALPRRVRNWQRISDTRTANFKSDMRDAYRSFGDFAYDGWDRHYGEDGNYADLFITAYFHSQRAADEALPRMCAVIERWIALYDQEHDIIEGL